MRVVYLADAPYVHTRRWVRHFVERGVEAHVISFRPAEIDGATVHYVDGFESIGKARRGITGGFTLAREPVTLTLPELVNAVDPVQRTFTCPLGLPEHEPLCSLHRRLDMAYAMFEEVLRGTTFAALLVTRIVPPVTKG